MTSTMLIIGEGTTTYGLNQIIKQDSFNLVSNLYGENSDLTQAFALAQSVGATHIYLANAPTKTAYIDILQIAIQYDFTYIVPIGIRFSDRAFNKQLNRQMTFAEIFLRITSLMTESIVVMTDNHASLYEDIDHYLNDMKEKITRFKTEAQSVLENGRQLWFVANNLKNVAYSNVLLTALMTITELPHYPNYPLPEALFDIDAGDINNKELIYFKNNVYANNSIENFINFHNENNAYKIAPIDMVIRQINKDIDLTYFSGKLFNNQVKLKIQNLVQEYLNSIKGKMIRDFSILSIDTYLESDYSYTLIVYFKILPMNALEECDVIIEV